VDFNDAAFLAEPKFRIRYKQGRQLLKQGKAEEAADLFGQLLEALCVFG